MSSHALPNLAIPNQDSLRRHHQGSQRLRISSSRLGLYFTLALLLPPLFGCGGGDGYPIGVLPDDELERTGLMLAIIDKNKSEVERLIAHQADVNARDVNGTTPLVWSVYGDWTWGASALIDAGAEVDAHYGRLGATALISADSREMADLLLRSGASTKAENSRGETALHWAARGDDPELVELLIQRGADINAVSDVFDLNEDWAPWIDKSRANWVGGETPLFFALKISETRRDGDAWKFVPRIVAALLDAGADVDVVSMSSGDTVLHDVAVMRGVPREAIEFILRKEPSLEVKNHSGYTPLNEATFGGNVLAFDLLLGAGASLSGRHPLGGNALALFDRKASRDIQNSSLYRRLRRAVERRLGEMSDEEFSQVSLDPFLGALGQEINEYFRP